MNTITKVEGGVEVIHTQYRRSKRLMDLSRRKEGYEADEINPNQSCRRSKRLIDLSSYSEFHEEQKVYTNQPLGKKPRISAINMCKICVETKSKAAFFRINGCGHSYCSDCVAKYIASKLQNNVISITCPEPNCSVSIEPELCQSILPKNTFDKWCSALCETLILGTDQGYYCPFKKCAAFVINDLGETCKRAECPHCEESFCVECKVAWHRKLKCKVFQNQDLLALLELAEKKKWRRCPKCKVYIERSGGCDHMHCRCGCHFCYQCGKESCGEHP